MLATAVQYSIKKINRLDHILRKDFGESLNLGSLICYYYATSIRDQKLQYGKKSPDMA